MSGERTDWKDSLSKLRSTMTEFHESRAADPSPKVEASVKVSAEDLQAAAVTAQKFLDDINLAKGKLEPMQKAPGRVGDAVRNALRMVSGFNGPVAKFVKELKRAVEASAS
jgi:hypothetical protein